MDFGEPPDRARPAVVDEIVSILNVEALALLGLACVILIFDVAANERSSVALDLWGIPGLVLGVAAALLVWVTRDFRRLRRWTLPYVAFVLSLTDRTRAARKKLERPEVRRAFEVREP
ncbi:MAG: hypothetical protein WCF84_10015 [Anaerolineae bacterium]